MVLPLDQNSVLGGPSQTTENIDTSASPKTSFKTNTERSDDDEAFAGFLNLMREATKEITGKELSKTEVDRWREVGEVLVTELKIAAARTTVSSVPSFLAEHLRRRLFKKDRKEMSAPEIKGEENQPPWSISKEKLKECPDCGGTGFYYPKGFEGGVAKCKHEKLTESEHPSSSMSTEDKS